jgi:peptide/nickel transport system permease protein
VTDMLSPTILEAGAPAPEEVGFGAGDELTTKPISPRRMAWRRFLGHKPAVVCAVLLILMILFVVLAPLTARYGVNQPVYASDASASNRYLPPSTDAWFGTDDLGRDLYSRLIYGTRVSLSIGLAAAIIGVVIGTAVGAWAGVRGGLLDDLLMRVTDIFLAFPLLVSLLVMRNVLGQVGWLTPIIGEKTSIRFVILLFAIFGWMGVARVVRGQVLSLKEREFIEASRSMGAGNFRIVVRHLLPNSIGPILVALTFLVVAAIITEVTLSFFGFGPQPGAGSTSLGLLVGTSKENVLTGNWWMVVFPCAVLLLVTLTINMVGDGLRDATDPKMQRSHS